MRPIVIRTAIAAALFAFTLPAIAGPLSGDDPVVTTGSVYRTVDGDTFVVNLSDDAAYRRLKQQAQGDSDRTGYLNDQYKSIRVRLASVDTPESVHPDDAQNSQAGEDASALVTELTEGKDAEVACYDWGNNGRLICNLSVKDGNDSLDVGGWLIERGISPYVTYFGNNPFYHNEYKKLETSAAE